MCDENVDKLCSMLCSSPMSTYISSNIPITLFSEAGIIIPHIAISTSNPAVFSETVLPPVLGPVTISEEYCPPSSMDIGTTFSLSIRGCLAFIILKYGLSVIIGVTAFILAPRFAFAKYVSISITVW